MEMQTAIRIIVEETFKSAATAFDQRPNGENWQRLEESMYARQAITNPGTLHELASKLEPLGVGKWVPFIAQQHKSKVPQ